MVSIYLNNNERNLSIVIRHSFPCECLARETNPTLTLTLKCRLLARILDTVFKVSLASQSHSIPQR